MKNTSGWVNFKYNLTKFLNRIILHSQCCSQNTWIVKKKIQWEYGIPPYEVLDTEATEIPQTTQGIAIALGYLT